MRIRQIPKVLGESTSIKIRPMRYGNQFGGDLNVEDFLDLIEAAFLEGQITGMDMVMTEYLVMQIPDLIN